MLTGVCLLPSDALSEPWHQGEGDRAASKSLLQINRAYEVTALKLSWKHPPSTWPGLICPLDKTELVKPKEVKQ